MWNTYRSDDHHTGEPSRFAVEVLSTLPSHLKILELGCGDGNDALNFAQAGHTVLATDFSEIAIKNNAESFANVSNLKFSVLDITQPMPFSDNEFDAVYARLSLHYFPNDDTRNIFQEIHRVLVAGGYICFLCKSTDDRLYGEGTKIAEDMYERQGHIRHFFSKEFVQWCLKDLFEVQVIQKGTENFYSYDSAYIKVIARAVKY